MEHQQDIQGLNEKLANEISARGRDKEESTKQIKKSGKNFVQQQYKWHCNR